MDSQKIPIQVNILELASKVESALKKVIETDIEGLLPLGLTGYDYVEMFIEELRG